MKRPTPDSLKDERAELSVIGGVMLRPDLLPMVDLDQYDFSNGHHAHIWGAIRNLEAASRPIDPTTLADQLEQDGHADSVFAAAEAALCVPTPDNLEHYVRIVKRHRVGRDVYRALGDVTALLGAGKIEGPDALIEMQQALARIDSGERDERGKSLGDLAKEHAARVARGEVKPASVKTGLTKLDAKTGGAPLGVPTLVLAPPGCGKSTLMMSFCEGAEKAESDTPLVYTYEDGWETFGQRVIARHSGVPTEVIRSGEITREHQQALARHWAETQARKTVIIRAAGMGVEDLVRDVKSRRLKHKGQGTTGRLVVVDYVQRMPLPSMHQGTKNDRIGETSRRLADLAATEGIAVVVCSQVGRQVAREQRVPILQDARDCGELENDAKLALGLFRPGTYNMPASDEERAKKEGIAPLSLLEIHILKNHQGSADCHVEAFWDLKTHTIVDSPEELTGRGL